MRIALPKTVRIEEVIDRIEGLKSPQISVDYDTDYSWCRIAVEGSSSQLVVEEQTVTFHTSLKKSPQHLLDDLKTMQGKVAQLAGSASFLLG